MILPLVLIVTLLELNIFRVWLIVREMCAMNVTVMAVVVQDVIMVKVVGFYGNSVVPWSNKTVDACGVCNGNNSCITSTSTSTITSSSTSSTTASATSDSVTMTTTTTTITSTISTATTMGSSSIGVVTTSSFGNGSLDTTGAINAERLTSNYFVLP
jgi:hypothetical protein